MKKLVYLSVHHVDDAPHIPHFGGKVAIEAAIRKSGIDYTILRPNNFYQNDDRLKDVIINYGVYPQPMGDIGLNRVDVRDIAEAAAQAFAGRAPNQTIALVGPDVLTGASTAQVYSRHLEKTIAYGGDDLDAWEKQVLQFLPPWMVFDFKMMSRLFPETWAARDRRRAEDARNGAGTRPSPLRRVCGRNGRVGEGKKKKKKKKKARVDLQMSARARRRRRWSTP